VPANVPVNARVQTATYYINRALCHLHTKQWQRAIDDGRRALELDVKSVKAHFILGRALLALGLHDEAIKALTRASQMAEQQKLLFGEEIMVQLRIARKHKFNDEETIRITQEIELHTYLNRLIDEDTDKQVAALSGGGVVTADSTTDDVPTDMVSASC
jgi:STIP1 family protein 1